MKELESIISELVSINRRLANNFKTEEGKELRADLFDITQKLELYKQDQNLQLQQTGVSGSYFAVCYSTNEGLFFVDEEDNQTKSQGNAKKFKSVKEAEMYINKELCGFGNVIPL